MFSRKCSFVCENLSFRKKIGIACFCRLWVFFKACVRYFSLFLKDQCSFWLFKRNALKRNLTYSCFIFPLVHEHLFSLELLRAVHLLITSCFQKRTVCVIEIILVTLPLVQMNKAQREVNQQIKHKSR